MKWKSFLIALLSISSAFSTPISMYIGTFSIDDYLSNGGGMGNLSYMIGNAQNFYLAAQQNISQYTANTLTSYHSMDKRNTAVTSAAFKSNSSTVGEREYNDFVGYSGMG